MAFFQNLAGAISAQQGQPRSPGAPGPSQDPQPQPHSFSVSFFSLHRKQQPSQSQRLERAVGNSYSEAAMPRAGAPARDRGPDGQGAGALPSAQGQPGRAPGAEGAPRQPLPPSQTLKQEAARRAQWRAAPQL